EGGAEIVMIFDTAAGELDPRLYQEHVVPQLARLASAHKGKLGYYSKFTHAEHLSHSVFHTPGTWAGLGVDHRWNLAKTLGHFKNGGFTQGNFDQSLLFLEGTAFENCLKAYLQPLRDLSAPERAGWVCGLGHGVLP